MHFFFKKKENQEVTRAAETVEKAQQGKKMRIVSDGNMDHNSTTGKRSDHSLLLC